MSMPDKQFKIIPADENYLTGIVACHETAFPGEFLTLLGSRFLRSFYKYYCNHPDAIFLLAKDNKNGLIGGLVAGGAPYVRAHFMRKYIPMYLPVILYKSLMNSKVRKRLMEHTANAVSSLSKKIGIAKNRNQAPDNEYYDPSSSSLLSICTHSEYRGKGAAAALMEAFKEESEKRGYHSMRLSVHNNNVAAIKLYKKMGWNIVMESHRGIYFKKDIKDNSV